MKVHLGKVDEAGCGHYRIAYPAAAAKSAGADCEVVTEIGELTIDTMTEEVLAVDRPECDVIVFQRPLKLQSLQLIRLFQQHGVAVVVDVDDDFTRVDPAHLGWELYQPHLNKKSNWRNLARACHMADWVTVTTPALAAQYGPHGRVSVLPNYVPAWYEGIPPAPAHEGTVIGWPGTVAVHPNDLQATFGGVRLACDELDATFMAIGDGHKVATLLGLPVIAFSGMVDFDEYPSAIANLDVGIVPLADTPFNEAKSCLKGLELAAMGVPFVASAVADYLRLASQGVGITAKARGRNWKAALCRMAGPEGRERADEARRKVFDELTYERHAEEWIDAWRRALGHRQKPGAVLHRQPTPKTGAIRGN